MHKKSVLFNASDALIARLDAATSQQNITRTSAIIRAIERYLPELESPRAVRREWDARQARRR